MKSTMLTLKFALVLLQIPFFYVAPSKVSSHLSRGSSISVKDADALVSNDKTFTCGFYATSVGTNAYWFAIWFTNSKDKTVVWMANRDNPVNGHGSSLTLQKDGAMVLTDLDGSTAWQTNTTFTDVVQAELLDSGNLVLKDSNGHVLWQSFDYPMDTLLPNQPFTKNTRLISRVSPKAFASGYFSFFFDSDNVLKMIYDGPEISSIYWPNLDRSIFDDGRTKYNSTRIAVLDDKGTFIASDQMGFNASDVGHGIKRRLTMDPDGILRLYSLNDSSGLWVITWQAVLQQCNVHGLCGRNGICVYTPKSGCSCPPRYEPVDSTDWSKGCKPKFKRSCSDSGFVEMNHVDYYGYDLNYTPGISFEQCRQLCLGDCRCTAFSYRLTDNRVCFTKGTLFNGYRSTNFPGIIYLRVPKIAQVGLEPTVLNVSKLGCHSGEHNVSVLNTKYLISTQKLKWVYLYSFVSTMGAFEVIILVVGWFFLFRKHGVSKSMEDGYRAISSQFRSFSYNELNKATNNFKEILGSGGFGAVYKGVLEDERRVAVKKLEGVVQGEEEFWAEVNTIGRINHLNLARMWGFCSERKKRLLVYEYVENGSLDKHLFSSSANDTTPVLGWKERFKIALGTAKGLGYLHHECLEWVIHCDIKPENILLDIDFEPKISDFGLAKLSQRDDKGSFELTRIRGTKGYMAPEWTTNLPVTSKVDVYSYGVVILELVRGVRLSSLGGVPEEEVTELASFVRLIKMKALNKDQADPLWVEELVDPKLEGQFIPKQVAVMIEVGLSCVEDDRNKRPTMETIAQLLIECEDEIA